MKIHYWSPFFTNIATIKAVINSANSLTKFSKNKKYKVSIIDAIGEWDKYRDYFNEQINIIKLNKVNFLNIIPKDSYIKSRFSYIFIFIINFLKLKNYIRKEEPDFLIIHLITSLPITLSLFFKKKTKIILRISGLPKINLIRHLFWKIFSKKIYRVTCPTQETCNFLKKEKIFPEHKLFVLKDPIVDIEKFIVSSKETIEKKFLEKKIILGIGRLTKQKNFELLIKFFYEIEKKYPDFILIIIGEGEKKKQLEELVIKLNLTEKVYLIGYKNNVYKFLVNSKYFVLSSLWEDPGFVLIEAALSNLTILSSNCPNGPNEIIKDKNFLFNNNDQTDLIKKFENLEKNMSKREIFEQKKLVKKRVMDFTKFSHYKNLIKILT